MTLLFWTHANEIEWVDIPPTSFQSIQDAGSWPEIERPLNPGEADCLIDARHIKDMGLKSPTGGFLRCAR